MLFLLINLFLFVAINCVDFSDIDFKTEWFRYKSTHKRLYRTAEDEDLRFNIWQKNLKFINEHNKKFEQGLVSFSLAMNEYGDMTTKEFEVKQNGVDKGLKRKRINLKKFNLDANITVPEEFSWLAKGYVTRVKNQGACGSCWAFAAIGCLEALFFKKSGKLINLSEQILMDCSLDYGNMGCLGGLMENAFQYTIEHGIETSESYPYNFDRGVCKANSNSSYKISGYTVTAPGDESELVKACALNGPIAVSIDASKDTFRFYKEGIYYEPSCSPTDLDHGVLMVGYGVDKVTGAKYYEIKNSWGENWGQKGYIKMARDRNNNCGIATESSYPFL